MPKTITRRSRKIRDIVIGRLTEDGRVDFPGNPTEDPIRPRSLVPLPSSATGREVALSFESGDPRRPIVMGLIQTSDRLELVADREIVIRCGQAEITLTKAGKILIRGTYVSSRSSGMNRIKGASVQIN